MPAASSLISLLVSVLFLIAGNGLLNTLVPMRGKLEGFADGTLGLIGSAYFVGMLLGTFAAPIVIRRAGAIGAFASLVSIAVVVALALPALPHWAVWMLLRGIIGFVFAGLYAVIESWLNARSDNTNRGRVYALYQIVTFAGSACGQEVLAVAKPSSEILFSLAAALLVMAVIPVVVTKTSPPRPPRTVTLRVGWLARLSPIGAVGALCIGATNGSFYSLAPVYGLSLGMSPAATAGFMTAVTLGTAMAIYPVARLSDTHDRRFVLLAFSSIGVLAETLLVAAGNGGSMGTMVALGMILGASTMVLYTVAISHANDRAGAENAVAVSAGMLFLYCVGAIVMPAVGSVLMGILGPAALFAQNAAIHALLACFVAWRLILSADHYGSARLTPRAG